MTFEEEWELLRKKSLKKRMAISSKYPKSSKQLENWEEEKELKEERKQFYDKLKKLKNKYGR